MLARLGLERAGAEDDVIAAGPRVDAENPVIGLADRGVRSSVVRLPPVPSSSSWSRRLRSRPDHMSVRNRAFRQPS